MQKIKTQSMSGVNLVFPHQLFFESPLFQNGLPFVLIEEHLFFNQYNFHKQKLAFHRASMKSYARYLGSLGHEVQYVDAQDASADIRQYIRELPATGVNHISCIDPTDDWLHQRLTHACKTGGIAYEVHHSPLFLNNPEELARFFRAGKKKFFQTEFYTQQRKLRNVLVSDQDKPVGGKWSFDAENRKKYPKGKIPPEVESTHVSDVYLDAIDYVNTHYSNNVGELDIHQLYPVGHASAQAWLQDFLEHRFQEFGTYEDAIVAKEHILHHSVLTPMLNVGLLTPQEILEGALATGAEYEIPINSLEGFVRQIMGWREFIRGIYMVKGSQQRTTNFWGFTRKIPESFYSGTTGIDPLDITIKKVLKTGYCHHIERLMVLGNFMLLCEFDPDEVYRWFMELFVDAYDWVMVPNVYGMSQFADGGLMATKPYISGSNYLRKMSDYPKGDWQPVWDGLFWRFMHVHRDFFLSNPRLGMLIRTFDKMAPAKQNAHLEAAEEFLASL